MKGVAEWKKVVKTLGAAMPVSVASALMVEAETVMTQSKLQVPLDEGVLRSSGTVDKPRKRGNTISVTIGYGGAAKDYAEAQHENMDYYHRTGSAKYLQRPMEHAERGFRKRLIKRVTR